MGLGFLFEKKILATLKKRALFASACFVMENKLVKFQTKNLKT